MQFTSPTTHFTNTMRSGGFCSFPPQITLESPPDLTLHAQPSTHFCLFGFTLRDDGSLSFTFCSWGMISMVIRAPTSPFFPLNSWMQILSYIKIRATQIYQKGDEKLPCQNSKPSRTIKNTVSCSFKTFFPVNSSERLMNSSRAQKNNTISQSALRRTTAGKKASGPRISCSNTFNSNFFFLFFIFLIPATILRGNN